MRTDTGPAVAPVTALAGADRVSPDGSVTAGRREPWFAVLLVASAAVWLGVVGTDVLWRDGFLPAALLSAQRQMVGPALVAVVAGGLSGRATLAGGAPAGAGSRPPRRRRVPCSCLP